MRRADKKRNSLYTIEIGPAVDAIRGHSDDLLDPDRADSLSPKPMTPRRVKRRSVMTRGTTGRSSGKSRRSERGERSSHTNTNRSSTRSSRRKIHQNPVTKLMDQQNNFPSFKHNPKSNLTENNLKSLNNDYIMSGQYHHPLLKKNTPNLVPGKTPPVLNSFNTQNPGPAPPPIISRKTTPDPIYYNMNSSSPLIHQQTSWNTSNQTVTPVSQVYNSHYQHQHPQSDTLGHSNPSYQHSTPNLTETPDVEEYITNRPPSVRSSYSNFHGTRPLSYNPNPTNNSVQENVFAGLSQQQQQAHLAKAQQPNQYQLPTQQQQFNAQSQPLAIPQLPNNRKARSREGFWSTGPPAYNLNYHTPPDSETTM